MDGNKLLQGDNLEFLAKMPDELVDGICIDPPFRSGRNYSNFKDDSSFWAWNDDREHELKLLSLMNEKVWRYIELLEGTRKSYAIFMAIRLYHMHRTLKKHGALFLICDDTEMLTLAMLLDFIFGASNKLNLVTYRRSWGRTDSTRNKLKRNCGYVLIYTKNKNHFSLSSEAKHRDMKKKELKEKYVHTDPDGNHYYLSTIQYVTKPRYSWNGLSGKWMYGPDGMNRFLKDRLLMHIDAESKHVMLKDAEHIKQIIDQNGVFALYQKKMPIKVNGNFYRSIDDCWEDLKPEQQSLKENNGNSGGKTEQLIERILKLMSSDSDTAPLVLDCFVGFGTLPVVADRMGYNWIAIDNSPENIKITQERIARAASVPEVNQEPNDVPYDGSERQLSLLEMNL